MIHAIYIEGVYWGFNSPCVFEDSPMPAQYTSIIPKVNTLLDLEFDGYLYRVVITDVHPSVWGTHSMDISTRTVLKRKI